MLISVTIPVYNDPEGLRLSLKSLVDQSYQNWEAIVVDDGSHLSLKGVVDHFKDSRIIFHRFNKNMGRPYARQKTFELLKGDYCGFLDAGDTFISTYLKTAVVLFSSQSLLGVSQSMTIVYDNELYLSNYNNSFFEVTDYQFNTISFASTIFNAKVCQNYEFNRKLKFSQDRHFLNFIALNFKGKIAVSNTHGYIYNQADSIPVSTTFKKYYYDLIRLLDERKYVSVLKGIPKLVVFPIMHFCLGYKSLLNLRFSKK